MSGKSLIAIGTLDFLTQGPMGSVDLCHESIVFLIHGQDFVANDLRQRERQEFPVQIG